MDKNTPHTTTDGTGNQWLAWVRRRKGSMIMLVIILTTGITMGLGSILRYGINEKKMNERHVLRQQAKNGAESLVEYGFADLIERFRTQSAVGLVQKSLASDPVTIPSTAAAFFANSDIDLNKSELIVGEVPDSATEVYIDPKDPTNEYDPLKGKRAYVRRIEVIGKSVATTTAMGGVEVEAYARQVLEVRDSPLFAHAMFYNMDMELHPGPQMNIYGPVHSNEDFWVQAVSGLKFHETVSSAGRILHGYKGSSINSDGSLKSNGAHTYHASVQIKNSQGSFRDMYTGGNKNSDSAWLDNRDSDWRAKASQRWDGFVQDNAHGVPALNPVGIDDFVPLNQSIQEGQPFDPSDSNSPLNLVGNHAYALIEPVLSDKHPNYKGDAVRKEKFAYKAGLILRVEKQGQEDHPYYKSGTYKNSSAGQTIPVQRNEYQVKAYKYERNSDGEPVIDPSSGYPIMHEVRLPEGLIGGVDYTLRNIDTNGEPAPYETLEEYVDRSLAEAEDEPHAIPDGGYNPTSDLVWTGMYDHREDKALDMLSLDIDRLSELVDDTDPNYTPTDWHTHHGPGADPGNNSNNIYTPSSDWNGVVYVEFPVNTDVKAKTDTYANNVNKDSAGKTIRTDDIATGTDPFVALQMVNGERFPRPSFAKEKGLTLATNGPLYTVGDVNANGNKHNNDANYPDNSSEPPGAVISDTLTVLSNRWYPDSKNNVMYSNQSNTKNRKAKYTEFSAAILTGLKPTIPSGSPNMPSRGARSGGAHNFPRFLEKWEDELTIRGSLVALFESEVHELAMPNNYSHYYSPPKRDWGFNDNFRNGDYPPGTPNTRTYRRVFLQDIPRESSGTKGTEGYVEGYVDAKKRLQSTSS